MVDDNWPAVCAAVVLAVFGIIGAAVGAIVQVVRRSRP